MNGLARTADRTIQQEVPADSRVAGPYASGYLKVIDWALFGVLCLAPFFLGGRYAVGRLVYVSLAATIGIAWSLHVCFDRPQRPRRSAGEWVFALAVLIVIVQLIPIPGGMLAQLSPSILDHLPLWSSPDTINDLAETTSDPESTAIVSSPRQPDPSSRPQLGTWNLISLAPQETLGGLAMLLAYGMLFVVVRGRLRTLSDVHRLLGMIAFSAVLLAVIGLVQLASGTEKHLGIYDHPFRPARGAATASFYNSNHYAHMLALGIGPLVAWLTMATMRRQRRDTRSPWGRGGQRVGRFRFEWLANPALALVSLGLVVFAGLLALSRGGVIVIGVAVVAAAAVLASRRVLPGKVIAAMGATAILVAVAMGVYGFDQIATQIGTITDGSVEQLDREGFRRDVWAGNIQALGDFWRAGAGVGAHRFLLPAYLDRSYSLEFTHAESGYLQIALETGVVGACLCLFAVGLCIYWCASAWRGGGRLKGDHRHTTAVAAVVAGLSVSMVHSIWDFVWYIPASMATTVVLAACACQLKQLATSQAETAASPSWMPRLAIPRRPALAWGVALVTIVASLWMLGNRAGPALASSAWDNYLRASVATRDATRREARDPSLATATYEERITRIDEMLGYLQTVLARDPKNGRAHLRFAAKCVERFQLAQQSAPNQMPISQIRAAANASQFPSRSALDEWLSRAIGQSRRFLDLALEHTRRGLQLCPMQADGYLALADISFLDTPGDVSSACLEQARQIDPNGGEVLIRTGIEAFATYDIDQAVKHWRQAYESGPEHRAKLISICAGRIPVQVFIEIFEPDLQTLRILDGRYEQMGAVSELEIVRRHRVSQVTEAARNMAEHETTGKLWYEAFLLNQKLENREDAVECARNAVQLAEHDMNVRFAVGRFFLTQGLYAESARHLEWCAARNPTHKEITRQLAAAKRGQLHQSAGMQTGRTANPVRKASWQEDSK